MRLAFGLKRLTIASHPSSVADISGNEPCSESTSEPVHSILRTGLDQSRPDKEAIFLRGCMISTFQQTIVGNPAYGATARGSRHLTMSAANAPPSVCD